MVIVGIILFAVMAVAVVWFFAKKGRKGPRNVDKSSRTRSGRIDIYSQDLEFELKDIKAGGTNKTRYDYAHWLSPDDQRKHWVVEGEVGSQWEKLWIEFTPSASGYVLINLRGSYYEDIQENHHDVWVDDCDVSGASIKNGDFEMIDPTGKPAYWGWNGTPDRYVTDGSQSHGGQCSVLVWHDIALVQKISVTAWQRYTISAWFKAYK
ncbi:MAG: hypothetical protein WC532_04405 [Candidatus Omnitrophota bacterium]